MEFSLYFGLLVCLGVFINENGERLYLSHGSAWALPYKNVCD